MVGGLFAVTGAALPAAPALADNTNAVCGYPPGSVISGAAKLDGPTAGPNSALPWNNAPDTPNNPGQAIKNVCID